MSTYYTTRRVVETCRGLMNDTVEPYFVSNPQILDFFNRKVEEICEEKLLLFRGRYATVTLKANEPWVAAPPHIVKLRKLVQDEVDEDTGVRNYREIEPMPLNRIEDAGYRADYGLKVGHNWRSRTGPPDFVVTDMEVEQWRVVPVPTEDMVCTVEAWTMPVPVRSLEDNSELDDKVLRELHLGVLSMAFDIEDADAIYDPRKAAEYAAAWSHAKDMIEARYQRDKRDGGRTVRYGGIGGYEGRGYWGYGRY